MSYGFSLIEILVSLLLLSLLLFGLDAVQVYSLKQSGISYNVNAAINQLNNMTERLLALQGSSGLAEQVTQWNAENSEVLPQGQGEVSGSFPNYVVTIYWGGRESDCKKNKLGEVGCLQEKIQLG